MKESAKVEVLTRIRATSNDLYQVILLICHAHGVSPIEALTALTEAAYRLCENLDIICGTPNEDSRMLDLLIEAIQTYDEYGQASQKNSKQSDDDSYTTFKKGS